MAARLKNRLFYLVSDKERQIGRRITNLEIAEATGVSIQLVGRWMRNEVTQFREDVILSFCRYFKCEVADLIYIDWGEEHSDEQG